MLYNIPIESLEERYSEQWFHWFPAEYRRNNIAYTNVYADTLSDEIQRGSFLDVCGTNYFKAGQLQIICDLFFKDKIKDGDIFFFHDLWFPGLEMLAYMRSALGIKFKICGIFHAGTWDEHDFLSRKGMRYWAETLENSWFKIIDQIFVATKFHKNLILNRRIVQEKNIYVTGLPIYPDFVESKNKQDVILFPHRLDPEKRPEDFDRLKKEVRDVNWGFIKTKGKPRTKKEYYDLLNWSKIAVSFSEQETWGIAMQEAVLCGCIPFVPDRLSYQEMYPHIFRFGNIEALKHEIEYITEKQEYYEYALEHTKTLASKFIREGANAIPKMIEIMFLPPL